MEEVSSSNPPPTSPSLPPPSPSIPSPPCNPSLPSSLLSSSSIVPHLISPSSLPPPPPIQPSTVSPSSSSLPPSSSSFPNPPYIHPPSSSIPLISSDFSSTSHHPLPTSFLPLPSMIPLPTPTPCSPPSSNLTSALKGFCNGFIYGASLRAFHAITLNVIFKKGKNLKEIGNLVLIQSYHQGIFTGLFILCYKIVFGFLNRFIFKKRSKYAAFIAGCLAGALIFSHKTNTRYQIILYLLSRALFGYSEKLLRLFKMEKSKLFPFTSAIYIGILMFLYESDKSLFGTSLTKSLQYLMKDSDKGGWNMAVPEDLGEYLERTLIL